MYVLVLLFKLPFNLNVSGQNENWLCLHYSTLVSAVLIVLLPFALVSEKKNDPLAMHAGDIMIVTIPFLNKISVLCVQIVLV